MRADQLVTVFNQVAIALLAGAQSLLGLFLLGDVSPHGSHDGRGHSFSAHGVVILEQAPLAGTCLQQRESSGHAVAPNPIKIFIKLIAHLRREEVAEVLFPAEFSQVIPEHFEARPVRRQNQSVQVVNADQLAAVFHQVAIAFLALAYFGFNSFSFGNILSNSGQAKDLAIVVADRK